MLRPGKSCYIKSDTTDAPGRWGASSTSDVGPTPATAAVSLSLSLSLYLSLSRYLSLALSLSLSFATSLSLSFSLSLSLARSLSLHRSVSLFRPSQPSLLQGPPIRSFAGNPHPILVDVCAVEWQE